MTAAGVHFAYECNNYTSERIEEQTTWSILRRMRTSTIILNVESHDDTRVVLTTRLNTAIEVCRTSTDMIVMATTKGRRHYPQAAGCSCNNTCVIRVKTKHEEFVQVDSAHDVGKRVWNYLCVRPMWVQGNRS